MEAIILVKVEDFVFINSSPIIANKTSYKKYEFDLSEFDGKDIYIAINCTTDDGLILMIDDFKVTAETLSTSDINAKNVDRKTPWMIAVENNQNPHVIKALIKSAKLISSCSIKICNNKNSYAHFIGNFFSIFSKNFN